MKKLLSLFLCLALAACLCLPAFAADTDFTFTALVDGKSDGSVAVGSTVEVSLTVKSNSAESFQLYAMQDYLTFDRSKLEFVPGSIKVLTDNSTGRDVDVVAATPRQFDGGSFDRVFVNRAATSPYAATNGVTMVSFKLKALAAGSCTIGHDTVEMIGNPNASTLTQYTVSKVSAGLTISSGGGTPGTGSPGGSTTEKKTEVPVSSNQGSVTFSAEVTGENASITATEEQLSKLFSSSGNIGVVKVDISAVEGVTSGTISANIISAVAKTSGTEGFEIMLPTGSVKLDRTATARLNTGHNITFSIENIDKANLTEVQKKVLGNKLDSAKVIDVRVFDNGVEITNFNGGKITVSVPYKLKTGEDIAKLSMWYVSGSGTIENLGGYYDTKTQSFVFVTTHLSKYVLVLDNNPFVDVQPNAYYYNAVDWAVEKGVTDGTTPTTFSPDAVCTRGQAVTFLWRAMGSPKPTSAKNPFTDIKADAYYYEAVLWAVEKGITDGMTPTTFEPETTVNRGQAVTFIHRAAGTPTAVHKDVFTDVAESAYYHNAVLWAVSKSITDGMTPSTFAPNGGCTRGQIVTFLYRWQVTK